MSFVTCFPLCAALCFVAWLGPAEAAAPDDATLAERADLATILRVALARNPDLSEARARREAAVARGKATTALPTPELKYEQWGTPLARPYALGHSDMLMLGVRQQLPPWGLRAAEGERARAETAATAQDERARRQELTARVRRAHAQYFLAGQERSLHQEHAALTTRLVDVARLHYQSGQGSQQDVLRLSLELARVHAELAGMEQELRVSRALLNTLMARPPDAPLGPAEAPTNLTPPALSALDAELDRNRGDVAASAQLIERSRATIEAARRAAHAPSVMVGLDYQYMPTGDAHHGYGAMISISLPWLSQAKTSAIEAAEADLRADSHAFEAAKLGARLELREAHARALAAEQNLQIVERDVLPQARRALEVAQTSYATGGGDAFGVLDSLRSYLQVRIERTRALARLAGSLADLDRAAGRELP